MKDERQVPICDCFRALPLSLRAGRSIPAPGSSSSGFIQNASIAPINSNPMLPRKGSVQSPVLSITYPKTRGETIAASAEPVFIRPLAEPENRGAMSIGIAPMGPIVNSEKNARLRKMATHVRLCNRRIGSIEATEQTNLRPRDSDALSCGRRPVENPVAYDSAERITQYPSKKNAGREERRALQIEPVAVKKKRWYPSQIEPERPTIAKIDAGDGKHPTG